MKHLMSASLLVCVGALFTWLTASLVEYHAVTGVSAAQARFVEPTAPVNTWGLSKKAPITAAVLVR